MGGHALTRETQCENHERQQRDNAIDGHEQAGGRQKQDDDDPQCPHPKPVSQTARKDHHHCRGTCADHIGQPPFTVG